MVRAIGLTLSTAYSSAVSSWISLNSLSCDPRLLMYLMLSSVFLIAGDHRSAPQPRTRRHTNTVVLTATESASAASIRVSETAHRAAANIARSFTMLLTAYGSKLRCGALDGRRHAEWTARHRHIACPLDPEVTVPTSVVLCSHLLPMEGWG